MTKDNIADFHGKFLFLMFINFSSELVLATNLSLFPSFFLGQNSSASNGSSAWWSADLFPRGSLSIRASRVRVDCVPGCEVLIASTGFRSINELSTGVSDGGEQTALIEEGCSFWESLQILSTQFFNAIGIKDLKMLSCSRDDLGTVVKSSFGRGW